ncbi:MAG: carboxypeptidase-like regulatory domain-containing protein, partial [Candidatus Aminicenantes bacterium]|nr:carboxypeptidase-like regulatory domain-containing protein [Candidatus Aminicenantes bacterium]
MSKRMKNYLLLVSVFLLASSLLLAQTQSGTLKVIVIDDEGNIVPGATLTLSSPVMMGSTAQVANTLGEALFINLTPGKYELTTSLEGFQAKITQAIEISIHRQTFLQVEIQPTPIQEEITVTAVVPFVDTSRSVIAEHVTH